MTNPANNLPQTTPVSAFLLLLSPLPGASDQNRSAALG